ncbi:MAG TPA: M42 family metallopeptidase [Firmicutes bacterium]|nr:M42 family metallopeptidase [Bacillota bacterium]
MYLETLSNLTGVSGNEGRVRRAIVDILTGESFPDPSLTIRTDTLGNLLVHKPGRCRGPKVMLAAHLDEVGLMVTSVEKSGHLKFKPVGGIDPRILVSTPVRVGAREIPGVIGCKAIHLQKPQERKKPYTLDQLYIDIGARDKEQALKLVSLGDYVSFDSNMVPIGNGCFRGKAFDDRAGCAVLIELLSRESELSFDVAFTVQEEVGSRGAAVAAYTLQPELAVIIEGTVAADTPGTEPEFSVTSLGRGPALSIMDRSFIAHRQIWQQLVSVAEQMDIPFQYRRFAGGGTDAGVIALSREGVKAAVVSVPCRYIHTPYSVLKESDLKHTATLIKSWLKSLV